MRFVTVALHPASAAALPSSSPGRVTTRKPVPAGHRRAGGRLAGVLAALAVVGLAAPARVLAAQVLVYTSENAFLADLASFGLAAIPEGFEDDLAWRDVRSSIVGGNHTAPTAGVGGSIPCPTAASTAASAATCRPTAATTSPSASRRGR